MDWKSEMSVEVSVIMPSYNVAEYYTQCMESVVGQSMKNIEIICVDAGSTDGTREIIMRFAISENFVQRAVGQIRIVRIQRDQHALQVGAPLRQCSVNIIHALTLLYELHLVNLLNMVNLHMVNLRIV